MEAKKTVKKADRKSLFQAIAKLGGAAECEKFLTDLCTPGELDAMADRWEVARLLDRGVPYRDIYTKTGVSTATVTRVARALHDGAGGYSKVLAKPLENL